MEGQVEAVHRRDKPLNSNKEEGKNMRMQYLFCACVLSMPSFAQEPPQQGQFQGQIQMLYDASKEETFKAKVVDVIGQSPVEPITVDGKEYKTVSLPRLTVMIEDKEYRVALASDNFLKEKNASYTKGDEITIKGVKREGFYGPEIRAREITKGEHTLVLLDKEGRSVWSPQRPPQATDSNSK